MAAAPAAVTSVVSDSVQPQRRQPTRLPRPWDSPGKNTGVGCHFLLQCMKVESESEVAQSCLTLSDPMDCRLPGSSVHGFSRQEYWSGVPLPSLTCPVINSISKELRLGQSSSSKCPHVFPFSYPRNCDINCFPKMTSPTLLHFLWEKNQLTDSSVIGCCLVSALSKLNS